MWPMDRHSYLWTGYLPCRLVEANKGQLLPLLLKWKGSSSMYTQVRRFDVHLRLSYNHPSFLPPSLHPSLPPFLPSSLPSSLPALVSLPFNTALPPLASYNHTYLHTYYSGSARPLSVHEWLPGSVAGLDRCYSSLPSAEARRPPYVKRDCPPSVKRDCPPEVAFLSHLSAQRGASWATTLTVSSLSLSDLSDSPHTMSKPRFLFLVLLTTYYLLSHASSSSCKSKPRFLFLVLLTTY